MKKRLFVLIMVGMLAMTSLMSGCSSSSAKKAQEYKELGISQMEQGDYEGAAASFQKALDQSVGSVGAEELDICYYKALALYKTGDSEGALEQYTALIDFDDDNWEVYYLRGNVYLHEGDTESALNDYAKAAALHENDTELYVHIYENLTDAGEEDSGQEYLEKVLSIKPSKAEDYYYIGDIYFLTGDNENAKANLLLAEDSGYDKALLLLGQIYAAEGADDDAKAAFSSYMEKYPDDAEALNELGEIALSAKEYENAVTYLESALEATDGSLEMTIRKNLIAAYEYSGDFQSAYEEARVILSNGSDAEVEREYEFLKTRVGKDSGQSTDSEAEETGGGSGNEKDGGYGNEEDGVSQRESGGASGQTGDAQ